MSSGFYHTQALVIFFSSCGQGVRSYRESSVEVLQELPNILGGCHSAGCAIGAIREAGACRLFPELVVASNTSRDADLPIGWST